MSGGLSARRASGSAGLVIAFVCAACQDEPGGQAAVSGQGPAATNATASGRSPAAANETVGQSAQSAAAAYALAPPTRSSGQGPSGALSDAPSRALPGGTQCPGGMLLVPGGAFRVGSPRGEFSPEETPPFETKLADFCIDATEVTLSAFAACVAAGACKPAHTKRPLCNARRIERADHPVNCVDWYQAHDYCKFKKARLPSEVEFEFVARGGAEYRDYPWGDASPDGRACWKHVGGSCAVKSFAPGAFGLYDVVGNVWEWTDDWFGPYPWPPVSAETKVYRGGSFSRRFEKWMRPRLRNRARPRDWGSHLGFRCALTPAEAKCPFGRTNDGTRCEFSVTGFECDPGKSWNGVRCARPGAPDCAEGRAKLTGHGCVLEHQRASSVAPAPVEDLSGVSRIRTPDFDADCREHFARRPIAFRYRGGTHDARTTLGRRAGCTNRDVGVGWNSTCCPEP